MRFLECIDNSNCTDRLQIGELYEWVRDSSVFCYVKINGETSGGFYKTRFKEVDTVLFMSHIFVDNGGVSIRVSSKNKESTFDELKNMINPLKGDDLTWKIRIAGIFHAYHIDKNDLENTFNEAYDHFVALAKEKYPTAHKTSE